MEMEWRPIGEIQFVVFVVLFMMNFAVFVGEIFVVFVTKTFVVFVLFVAHVLFDCVVIKE